MFLRKIGPTITNRTTITLNGSYTLCAVNKDGSVVWLQSLPDQTTYWSAVPPTSTMLYSLDDVDAVLDDPDRIMNSAIMEPDLKSLRVVFINEERTITYRDDTDEYDIPNF